MSAPFKNPEFDALFDGTLFSVMSWPQLEQFWQRLDRGGGWYLYAVGETRPSETADRAHVEAFVQHLDALLRKEHDEDYCGIVYADDLDHPSLIKVYDPNHLGSSCGSVGYRVLPGWVMSRMPPSDLCPSHLIPQNRRRWWQSFMDMIRGAETTH